MSFIKMAFTAWLIFFWGCLPRPWTDIDGLREQCYLETLLYFETINNDVNSTQDERDRRIAGMAPVFFWACENIEIK